MNDPCYVCGGRHAAFDIEGCRKLLAGKLLISVAATIIEGRPVGLLEEFVQRPIAGCGYHGTCPGVREYCARAGDR